MSDKVTQRGNAADQPTMSYRYESTACNPIDIEIEEPWVIIRNDPDATDGHDELTAVVGTESMAEAFCVILNQGLTAADLKKLLKC